MSEAVVFAFGAVVFIVATWATLAFGLARFHEIELADVEASPRIKEVVDTGLTEVHLTED